MNRPIRHPFIILTAFIIFLIATLLSSTSFNTPLMTNEHASIIEPKNTEAIGYISTGSSYTPSSKSPFINYRLDTGIQSFNLFTQGQSIDIMPFSPAKVQGTISGETFFVKTITSKEGEIFTLNLLPINATIKLDSQEPVNPNTPDRAPIGFHDQANCLNTTGWTCDADRFSQALQVHFYADGPTGSGTFIGYASANTAREPAVGANCGGFATHGFSFNIPLSLKDSRVHRIYSYAIGIDANGTPNNINRLLGNSPKNILCTSHPPRQPPEDTVSDIEDETVRLINDRRVQSGLPAFTANEQLRTAARWHSQDMANRNYFSHFEPFPTIYGLNPWDRAQRAGYPSSVVAEVIQRNNYPDHYNDPNFFVENFFNSQAHQCILMSTDNGDIACGYAVGAGNMGYIGCLRGLAGNNCIPYVTPSPPSSSPTPSLAPTIVPNPTSSGSCCRDDPNNPGYIDRSYCPTNCTACYGNIQCGTNGYMLCRWYYSSSSNNCQLSNCGSCRE